MKCEADKAAAVQLIKSTSAIIPALCTVANEQIHLIELLNHTMTIYFKMPNTAST